MRSTVLSLVLCAALAPAASWAQALPNVNLTRVLYNTRKATVKPTGELKTQIDAVDQQMAEATKQGRTGDVRRLIAKGMALLDGKAWTPALDFETSLVLRSERTVVDSVLPYRVRLEQIYSPTIDLSPAVSVTMRLKKRGPGAPSAATTTSTIVRELGGFDGVSRDLRESPFGMDVDLAGVPDDTYTLEAEVFDGAARLGATTLPVVLHKGLDERLRALETAAAAAPADVRADLAYPADFIRKVNRGLVGLGTFVVGRELMTAEATAAGLKGGKDPFKGRTGDFERHYLLAGANEVMPYRVYVPTKYAASRATPLVIALHGLGATEDSFFDSYQQLTPKLAEQHGMLLAAPLGFRVDGFYGSPIMGIADAAAKRRTEYSEKDVLEVVRLMRAQYNVDPTRIYLIGHSMGAIGTWALASKFPDVWAGLAPFSGIGSPLSATQLKGIPQFVVHGDADPTVNVNGSRAMVTALKAVGATVTYIEVPGGNHTDVVVPNLSKAFEFLASQRKSAPVATQPQP